MTQYTSYVSSPLGKIRIVCDEKHLLKIDFVKDKQSKLCNYKDNVAAKLALQIAKQLKEYFNGKRKSFSVPISFEKLPGTKFQKLVWKTLQKIPYGKTISYSKEAEKIKSPKSCRAVGNANGKNPIPIIIPCHRVIASNGKLGGYSSGLWRKEWLLNYEK